MTDLFSKFDPLIETREQLLSTGVTDPFNLVMEEVVSPTVAICNGKKTILLGTYNYMGMTFDPEVIAAGKDALDKFGSGTTGSRNSLRQRLSLLAAYFTPAGLFSRNSALCSGTSLSCRASASA